MNIFLCITKEGRVIEGKIKKKKQIERPVRINKEATILRV
jgi:hypothetical protein